MAPRAGPAGGREGGGREVSRPGQGWAHSQGWAHGQGQGWGEVLHGVRVLQPGATASLAWTGPWDGG